MVIVTDGFNCQLDVVHREILTEAPLRQVGLRSWAQRDGLRITGKERRTPLWAIHFLDRRPVQLVSLTLLGGGGGESCHQAPS